MTRIGLEIKVWFHWSIVACCVVVCHWHLFAHEGISAEEQIDGLLSQCCLQKGYNASEDYFVVVGSASSECPEPFGTYRFLMLRNNLMRKSDLLARKDLIVSLAMVLKAEELSQISTSGKRIIRQTSSWHDLSANKVLHGCVTLCCAESYAAGTYETAVAIAWARNGSSLLGVQKKFSALRDKGSFDSDEWTYYAKTIDVASVVGSLAFIDRKGVLRFVGIGCSDVEGIDVSSLRMKHAQNMALEFARGNLSLAINADMLSNEISFRDFIEGKEAEGDFKERLQVWMASFSRQSNKQTAFAPEVYATFAVHPITKRKMFVSVCGYEPWQLAELGIIDPQLQQKVCNETRLQNQPSQPSAVKIWNPNTGKFETVKE